MSHHAPRERVQVEGVLGTSGRVNAVVEVALGRTGGGRGVMATWQADGSALLVLSAS